MLFITLNTPMWLIYIAIFYANYLLLVPNLFNVGRIKYYVVASIALVALGYVGVQSIRQSDAHKTKMKDLPVTARSFETIYNNIIEGKHIKDIEKAIEPLNLNDSIVSQIKHNVTSLYLQNYVNKGSVRGGSIVKNDNNRRGNSYNIRDARNISVFYTVLLYYLFSLLLAAMEKSAQRKRDMELLRVEKSESELAFLKQQINPHFLFNALNSIYSLVLPYSDKASDAVIRLATMLRYMLYDSDGKEVSLSKEIDITRNYISIQRLKFNDITTIDLNVEGEILGHSIEPLLIIPFIENAFKYGADNVTPSYIKIDISVKEDIFNLKVENKVVITKDSGEPSGIGVANVKRRLEFIYPKQHTLLAREKDGVFYVELEIKL